MRQMQATDELEKMGLSSEEEKKRYAMKVFEVVEAPRIGIADESYEGAFEIFMEGRNIDDYLLENCAVLKEIMAAPSRASLERFIEISNSYRAGLSELLSQGEKVLVPTAVTLDDYTWYERASAAVLGRLWSPIGAAYKNKVEERIRERKGPSYRTVTIEEKLETRIPVEGSILEKLIGSQRTYIEERSDLKRGMTDSYTKMKSAQKRGEAAKVKIGEYEAEQASLYQKKAETEERLQASEIAGEEAEKAQEEYKQTEERLEQVGREINNLNLLVDSYERAASDYAKEINDGLERLEDIKLNLFDITIKRECQSRYATTLKRRLKKVKDNVKDRDNSPESPDLGRNLEFVEETNEFNAELDRMKGAYFDGLGSVDVTLFDGARSANHSSNLSKAQEVVEGINQRNNQEIVMAEEAIASLGQY